MNGVVGDAEVVAVWIQAGEALGAEGLFASAFALALCVPVQGMKSREIKGILLCYERRASPSPRIEHRP